MPNINFSVDTRSMNNLQRIGSNQQELAFRWNISHRNHNYVNRKRLYIICLHTASHISNSSCYIIRKVSWRWCKKENKNAYLWYALKPIVLFLVLVQMICWTNYIAKRNVRILIICVFYIISLQWVIIFQDVIVITLPLT